MTSEKRSPFLLGDRLFFENESESNFSFLYKINIIDFNLLRNRAKFQNGFYCVIYIFLSPQPMSFIIKTL